MKTTLKTWTGLGLATALVGAGLAGCAGENGEQGGEAGSSAAAGEAGSSGEGGEAAGGEGGETAGGEGGEGEGGEAAVLPVEQRLAFMAGHTEAGIALYRAGETEAAAPHLSHPVDETHADERAGLEALGFQPDVFKAVSKALADGKPASEIEPQLKAAQTNLAAMRTKAGGDAAAIVSYLMGVAREEYGAAVKDGKVADAREYQDAWGFVTVARQTADRIEGAQGENVRKELDTMLKLWPGKAPVPPASPAPAGQVSALASRVELALGQKGG